MNIDFELLLCAVGIAFIIEGLPWTLFPESMRKVMLFMTMSSNISLRRTGLFAIAMGLLIVWLVRG